MFYIKKTIKKKLNWDQIEAQQIKPEKEKIEKNVLPNSLETLGTISFFDKCWVPPLL